MENTEQLLVINHDFGPAVVLAGAGSGKTRTLTKRIERLVEFTEPNRIIAVSFTNAAATEMKNRAAAVNEKCSKIIACTYHKYCSILLRKYGKAVGVEPSMDVLDVDAYTTFIDYVKSSYAEEYDELKDFPSPGKLQQIFSIHINTGMSFNRIVYKKKYAAYASEIEELYKRVKEAGIKNQKYSFDDLLVYTDRLLSIDTICERIADSFDYIMVDEFQDTNDLQLTILLKLSKYNRNIVVVGDFSQSIYKFRGANVENIQKFIDSFKDCEVYSLSINYRSTQEILDAANKIMNTNSISWQYVNMQAYNDRHGKKPQIVIHTNDYTQVKWLIEHIQQWININHYDPDQISFLERSSTSSFLLESELNKNKIPYIKKGGKKFSSYVCVLDMVAFLSVAIHRANEYNWFEVLRRLPKIGNKTATQIAKDYKEKDFIEKYKKKSYYTELTLLKEKLDECYALRNNVEQAINVMSDYYFDLRLRAIESSKSKEDVKFDKKEALEKDKEVINILKNMALNYDRIATFLTDLALDSVKNQQDPTNCITISTIHSAKGLEWPVVVLLDCLDFGGESDSEYFDREEELRCLYVAITRAETELYVSVPQMLYKNGTMMYPTLSHFFRNALDQFEKVRA